MQKIHYSYAQITQMCEDLADKIKELEVQPTSIVGLIRGGCVPAVILSHLLGIPCKMLAYSSHNGLGDDKEAANQIPDDIAYTPGQLIVDDICDSGNTMKEVVVALLAAGNVCTTATIAWRDQPQSKFEPDLYGTRITTDHWLVFPWE